MLADSPTPAFEKMGHDTLDHPIVLLRGWAANASDPEHNTWKAVEEHLTQKGIPFIVPYYHRFASIEERANFAIGFIGRAYPSKQVHLIGHSLVRVFPTLMVRTR